MKNLRLVNSVEFRQNCSEMHTININNTFLTSAESGTLLHGIATASVLK